MKENVVRQALQIEAEAAAAEAVEAAAAATKAEINHKNSNEVYINT